MVRLGLLAIVALLGQALTAAPPPPAAVASEQGLGPGPSPRVVGTIWTGPAQWERNMVLGNQHPYPTYWTFQQQLQDRPWPVYLWGWPASQPPDASGAQFYTLPRERRGWYVQAINAARRYRHFELWMYGSTIWTGDPFTLHWDEYGRFADFYEQCDWLGYWEGVIQPWRATLSGRLRAWWWDAGALPDRQRSTAAWIDWLRDEQGIGGGWEAFAIRPGGPGRPWELDPAYAATVPQMAAYGGVVRPQWNFHPDLLTFVPPPGSRLYLFFTADAGPVGQVVWMTVDDCLWALRRGYGLMPDQPHDGVVLEALHRYEQEQPPAETTSRGPRPRRRRLGTALRRAA